MASEGLWDQFTSLDARNEGRTEELAAAGEPWDEGLIEEPFVERAQPIVEQVKKLASEDASPLWLPSFTNSQYYFSDYYRSGKLADLLSREFRVAVHEGDRIQSHGNA